MNEPILIKFDTEAPDWRVVSPGLNFEGICVKKGCRAYNQHVWIPKGYGKFNMHK